MAKHSAGQFADYLIQSDGWTRSEVDALLDRIGTDDRTESEWLKAVDEYDSAAPLSPTTDRGAESAADPLA